MGKKINWVRFDRKDGYVLVDWVRFDQKNGYVLTKSGYVLVGYVLVWVRFDLHPSMALYMDNASNKYADGCGIESHSELA